tara:strand:- start:5318 stop:6616 length:1299 start_codon:yes stop_codon:yes gene_type:complete
MKTITKNSIKSFKEAKNLIPGGVNSPARAFKSVDCNPIFISKAKGSKVYDIDGNSYIDFVSSWGPMILGHADKDLINTINSVSINGTSYGAPTIVETKMAKKITEMFPSIEKVRMVNSGTEATMSAIRLARGFTKKDLIIKFSGNYHGHGDSFLISAGSGVMTLGEPDSPGVTINTAKDTLIAEFNNIKSVEYLFNKYKNKVSAVIVEPVSGNMGVVKPKNNFLKKLRLITKENNSLLIFDEVMTGFRLSSGGAQKLYNIKPDITTLGKIIGGGLPVGAYGGKKEIMDYLSPNGPVYQAGTLSGNPLAMSAGLCILNKLNDKVYYSLEKKSQIIYDGLVNNINDTGIKAVVNRVGSMLTLFFTNKKEINNYEDAKSCNIKLFAKYFKFMLDNGIYLPPSQFESLFISDAISYKEIDYFIKINKEALKQIHNE